MDKKVLIAIIAYNEEKSIGRAIESLIDFRKGPSPFDFDIVVIDNGSTDATAATAAEYKIPVVSHCVNSGGSGGTVSTYFRYAEYHGYDVMAQFDGDAQHLASELPAIILPVLNEEADYVIGSRYLKGEGFQSTAIRRAGISLFNSIVNTLVGIPISDSTSGARAYGRSVIRFFGRSYQQEIYDPVQLLILTSYFGGRIKEVPIVMQEREAGVSEFSALTSITYMIRGLSNVVACFLQRHKVRRMGVAHGA